MNIQDFKKIYNAFNESSIDYHKYAKDLEDAHNENWDPWFNSNDDWSDLSKMEALEDINNERKFRNDFESGSKNTLVKFTFQGDFLSSNSKNMYGYLLDKYKNREDVIFSIHDLKGNNVEHSNNDDDYLKTYVIKALSLDAAKSIRKDIKSKFNGHIYSEEHEVFK